MAKTVGMTTAIATRLIMENRIPQRGVISPIYKEIYDPVLKELEKYDVIMIEDTNRVGVFNRAKL